MRLFLFGSTGYIGGWVQESFISKGHEVVFQRVDVCHKEAVFKVLQEAGTVDVVLNAIGKTGTPNVDWCEEHRRETVDVNIIGAVHIAEACEKLGLYMVQIGSGCIFSGVAGRFFVEDDKPNFFGSFYSQTKAVCEGALREFSNVCVLRIRMPLSAVPHPKNLFTKL